MLFPVSVIKLKCWPDFEICVISHLAHFWNSFWWCIMKWHMEKTVFTTRQWRNKQTLKNTQQFFFLFPGEPLHGYRVCIQAILQDKPKIATQNLPEVSECVPLIPAHNCQITASLHLSAVNVQLLSFLKTGYLKFFKLAVSVLLSNVLGICFFLSAYNNMYVCIISFFLPL